MGMSPAFFRSGRYIFILNCAVHCMLKRDSSLAIAWHQQSMAFKEITEGLLFQASS
jgi:hypothetical protein